MAGTCDPMEALIASWIEDRGAGRRDDYIGRGRRYGDLSAELLIRSWGISCQCCEAIPGDSYLKGELADLTSEMELRGLALPRRHRSDAYQDLLDSTAPLDAAGTLSLD